MTKKDIVRTISEEVGLTQEVTKKIVQRTFDSIIEALVRDQRIELRNFGVFEVKSRAARKARNPRTGQQVDVPEKHVVTFKPGKVMDAKISKLDSASSGSDGSASNLKKTESNESSSNSPPSPPPASSPSGRWDVD